MFFKRILDISSSLIGLILFAPIAIIVALLIKLLMPGPVLYVQTRIGKGGYGFRLFKFRTMLVKSKISKDSFDAGDQSRITSLGKILRKTKIDEIPQLINVLIGEMSIVGPRPEVKRWTEVYPEKWKIAHTVKPGITDNASIEFRNEEYLLSKSDDPIKTYREEILPRKLELYIDYVNNQSFLGDLKIIFRTINTVIFK